MEDNLKKIKIEDDLKKTEMEDDLNKNANLTNSTAQRRQPDQHNNQKYIGTSEKINLNWL
jgi:hypothetical protein